MKQCVKPTIFALSISLLLLVNSCDNNNPVGSGQSIQIVPLAIGNTWNYSGVAYDSTGVVVEEFGEIYKVYDDTVLYGKKMFLYTGFSMNTDSGLVMYAGSYTSSSAPNDTIHQYRLVYKYPTYTGDKYNNEILVANSDTAVIVTAGTYKCIKYQYYYDGDLLRESYISSGIGQIKYVTYHQRFSQLLPLRKSSVVELKSFILN